MIPQLLAAFNASLGWLRTRSAQARTYSNSSLPRPLDAGSIEMLQRILLSLSHLCLGFPSKRPILIEQNRARMDVGKPGFKSAKRLLCLASKRAEGY